MEKVQPYSLRQDIPVLAVRDLDDYSKFVKILSAVYLATRFYIKSKCFLELCRDFYKVTPTQMEMRRGYILVVFAVFGLIPVAYAEPTVEIVMEKTTYSYCEKLFYIIKVSDITGNPAIIHIRDSAGKGSSAIPINITDYENPVPSLIAFNKYLFPLGNYFIDVEYGGQKTTAEFTLIDSGEKCLPDLLKPIVANWIGGIVSDGVLIDALQKYADKEILDIPFHITEQNIDDVQIPFWVKSTAFWWIEEDISDDEFVGALEYLMEKRVITVQDYKNT